MDLSDDNCVTYGHSTSRENAKCIIKEGLRLNRMEVDEDLNIISGESGLRYHCLTIKPDIMSNKEHFENWGHFQYEGTCVVVLKLPNGYFSSEDNRYPLPYGDCVEFYGKDVLSIRPEFICGYYDTGSKVFVENPQYYDNLSEYEKIICDDKLQQCYELAKVHPADTNHITSQEKRLREKNSNGQVAKKQKKEVHEQVHCEYNPSEYNTSGWTVGDEDEDSASFSL